MFLIQLNASLHCSTELLLWHIWCLGYFDCVLEYSLILFDASFGGCTIFHVALLWQVTSYFHLNISGMCFRWNYWMYISLQITLMHDVMIFINRKNGDNGKWKTVIIFFISYIVVLFSIRLTMRKYFLNFTDAIIIPNQPNSREWYHKS